MRSRLRRSHEVEPVPYRRRQVAHVGRVARRRTGDRDRLAVHGPGGQGDRARHLRPHHPRPLRVPPSASGHGSNSIHGFQTGDLVRATVPTGKKAGVHTGRVLVRSTGIVQHHHPARPRRRDQPPPRPPCFNERTATATRPRKKPIEMTDRSGHARALAALPLPIPPRPEGRGILGRFW